MKDFIFAVNATMPVFLIIILGKILIKLNVINEQWIKITDRFAFRVALPATLFIDIADMEINPGENIKLVVFCIVVTTIMFFGTWLLAYLFLKDKKSVGAFTQSAVRGSAAILGIPFAVNIYGHAGMVPLMILAVVPLFNAYSVIILAVSSHFENKEDLKNRKNKIDRALLKDVNLASNRNEKIEIRKKTSIGFKDIVRSIVSNPLIIGIALGFPFCIFQIKLPFVLHQSISRVGDTATALMLISLGAGFEIKNLTGKFGYSFVSTMIKLVLLPLIFIPLAVYFGFRNDSLIAILIMLGTPSAISGYVMAKSMDNDYVLMSSAIVMTTLFSAVTFTIWIFILKSMALI